MPWKIVRRLGRYVVQNAETHKTAGTHDTEAAAKKQMAALYANVPDATS